MRYDFGNVYKEIRESKGLTQEDVCGSVLSRTSLSKIEVEKQLLNMRIWNFFSDKSI